MAMEELNVMVNTKYPGGCIWINQKDLEGIMSINIKHLRRKILQLRFKNLLDS